MALNNCTIMKLVRAQMKEKTMLRDRKTKKSSISEKEGMRVLGSFLKFDTDFDCFLTLMQLPATSHYLKCNT